MIYRGSTLRVIFPLGARSDFRLRVTLIWPFSKQPVPSPKGNAALCGALWMTHLQYSHGRLTSLHPFTYADVKRLFADSFTRRNLWHLARVVCSA